MTYKELFEITCIETYNNFGSVVKSVSLEDIDNLCKIIKNSLVEKEETESAIETLCDLFTSNKLDSEETSLIYYRVFAFVNNLTLDYRAQKLLSFHKKAFDHFEKIGDNKGIILIGVYLVDAIMSFENDSTTVTNILDKALSSAIKIDENRGDLYETILKESKISYWRNKV